MSRPNSFESQLDIIEEELMEENPVEPLECTFDLTLPTTHSYLGQDLKEIRGRTIFDDGVYMKLPLLQQDFVVLFPGQTLPMILNTRALDMLTCLQTNRTIGVCCRRNKKSTVGVTAEIYECTDIAPGRCYNFKAKGRQRFKILKRISQGYDVLFATVKILPEITLGPPFFDERLASLDCMRVCPVTEEDFKKQERIENLDAAVTPWPGWVYRQYDPTRLSFRLRKYLKYIERRGRIIPEDPTSLSFWVAQNVLLDDNAREDLLQYDCAISRLQMEIKYLQFDKVFLCNNCDAFIGRQKHMLLMSIDGPLSIYCNNAGVIHDVITLYHAQGLLLCRHEPVTRYTWFPGYAWTIAHCKICNSHIGWKFGAVKPNLKPEMFWGLSRRNIKNKEI